MPKGPQGQKRPTLLTVVTVFGPAMFVVAMALADWIMNLKSPVWFASEFLAVVAIMVWRRYYARHVLNA
jgi:hypothetical protein